MESSGSASGGKVLRKLLLRLAVRVSDGKLSNRKRDLRSGFPGTVLTSTLEVAMVHARRREGACYLKQAP